YPSGGHGRRGLQSTLSFLDGKSLEPQNEPEDHFGTLLMLAAWLAENGRETERDQLLAWHLLPWSTRFLSVFVENAAHPFYTALGKLAQLTLAEWQSTLLIPIVEKTLYR
ncbi:hypothetical protein VBJ73_12670, partial [Enterobacter hormaechei]|nr:hypothetical protein [Enterobacter hormaechei]MEA3950563.1 hypothetical protein [Enterobacter hormaechei]